MLRFSLIICTRGRPQSLKHALIGVASLHYSAFELIVICDPNDLDTAECLARHAPGAKIGASYAANLAQARNAGLSMAQEEIVAFLDDDAVPEPDWLTELAAAYLDPEIAAAGGFIRASNGKKFQSRVVVIDEFGADHHHAQIPSQLPAKWFLSLTGTNFSVRRAAALAVGGFDENYTYFLEETDFLLRLKRNGGRISVVEQAVVRHAYAKSDIRKKNGAPKSLRSIARSKAYFCYINRNPQTPVFTITMVLKTFVKKKRLQIVLNLLLGRLHAREITPLLEELKTGIREGQMIAKKGRIMPDNLINHA